MTPDARIQAAADQLEAAWRDETIAAAHGGLWRTAYAPRSALGLAAVRGLLSAPR